MRYDITITGDDGVNQDLKRYSDKINTGLIKEVASTASKIHGQARKDAPVDTGHCTGQES